MRSFLWVTGGFAVVVGGLLVGAHLFDDLLDEAPSPALEGEDAPVVPAPWNRIRVEVLNAAGVTGLAARARDHLRAEGFDVVHFGNAPAFGRDRTVVLARSGSVEQARAVADRMGVTEVDVQVDTTLFVDVTVLLGTDWPGETSLDPDPSEGTGGEASRWDLRRLLEWDDH